MEKDLRSLSTLDVFQVYKDHVLKVIKPSERDTVTEVFASTEVFDLTNYQFEGTYACPTHYDNNSFTIKFEQELVLPFETCFVRTRMRNLNAVSGLFLHEYSPDYITGAQMLMFNLPQIQDNRIRQFLLPFTFNLVTHEVCVSQVDVVNATADLVNKGHFSPDLISNFIKGILQDMITDLFVISNAFANLNKMSILVDTSNRSEYYSFKDKTKQTIKVPNRKIYYVMEKRVYEHKDYKIKPLTRLEYSHAFKVRGHWRRISDKTLGKDRNGNRVHYGRTWVTEFLKGEGELVNKVRVVK